MRIAINGFGRIGRIVARTILNNFPDMQIVAINDLVPPQNLAYLLKFDTVHGRAKFSVRAGESSLFIGNQVIQVFQEKEPCKLPWDSLGVDYVVESTGRFTTLEGAKQHLQAGAKRVLITAPVKEEISTFVVGVNHKSFDPKTDFIISNASCTTNCLAPLAKVLLDSFGIEEGLMSTVHSITASQPTVDGPSKKDWRGGRAASLNIIPSSTGAAIAVTRCIPQLKGKLTGMAFRVPTPDVSVVDLTVRLSNATTLEQISREIKIASQQSMKGIIDYTEEEVVSSDFIGNTASCIFDVGASLSLNSHFFKLVAWYDNEVGYSHRVIDLLRYIAEVEQ